MPPFFRRRSIHTGAVRLTPGTIHSKKVVTMSMRTLVIGLFFMYAVLLMPAERRRAVHRHAVFRPGDRRAVPHRSLVRRGGIRRRSSRSRANRSACSARRIDAVADLGIEKKQHPRAAHRAAARPQAQVPHQLSADDLQRRLDGASRVRLQRHPVQRQPAGHPPSSRGRHGISATNTTSSTAIGGSSGFVLQAKATDIQANLQAASLGTEFARAQAPIPDDRRHRAGLRGAEHLDHRRARLSSRFRQASTSATRRTTSTSTSTAR